MCRFAFKLAHAYFWETLQLSQWVSPRLEIVYLSLYLPLIFFFILTCLNVWIRVQIFLCFHLPRVYTSEIWTVSLLFFFLRQAMMSVTERGSDFIALILLHQYPAHSLQLKNNMALAPQRLVHNEKYAAVEHQGHCRIGFLKRAEKSSTEWANKARWLMNSRNSLTNPIASDKLKCQRPACVASHYLCYSVISLIAEPAAHGRLENSLRQLWRQRYSNRRPGQMLVSEYWLDQTSRRL